MLTNDTLPAAVARYVLRYDRETGLLYWRVSTGGGIKAGDVAGCATTHSKGYVTIRLFSKRYVAHKLAWLIVRGCWPEHQIDHRNNNPADNRWSNLRKADDSQNRANSKRYANNKTGFKGVSFNKTSQKFCASIAFRGRSEWLGQFDTARAAGAAYARAARRVHGSFARIG